MRASYPLCPRMVLPLEAGQEGLEPPTCGVGDRCSTNGATALCLPILTGSPGAPYDGGTTGNTSVAGCDPGCSAGFSCCGSSGACTPRKPALPIVAQLTSKSQGRPLCHPCAPTVRYSTISVTTPAPTVLPPSRMAKFNPSSIAIGEINSTFITVLSPGITISTPSSRRISPVTSVVLK